MDSGSAMKGFAHVVLLRIIIKVFRRAWLYYVRLVRYTEVHGEHKLAQAVLGRGRGLSTTTGTTIYPRTVISLSFRSSGRGLCGFEVTIGYESFIV